MKKLLIVSVVCLTMMIRLVSAQIPTVTGFTPSSGPVGTSVTITGTNFSATPANNYVLIGAARATVISASPTQLVATVPTGQANTPIVVTVGGLTGASARMFNVTFSSNKIIDLNSFADKVSYPADSKPIGMAMGDIDGDGKADLAVANYGSNTVRIYRNISQPGSSTYFDAGVSFACKAGPQEVAIGDLDGDGKPELLVTTTYPTGYGSIYPNTSTPGPFTTSTFGTPIDFAAGTSDVSPFIGDIDNDGKPEFMMLNPGLISIYHNNISGSMTAGSFTKVDIVTIGVGTQIIPTDIDGDGKPELICATNNDRLSVYRNTTTPGTINAGNFSSRSDFTVTGAYTLDVGDLDGDNKTDIAVIHSDTFSQSYVSIFQNTSTAGIINGSSLSNSGDFSVGVGAAAVVTLGDIDGDGKLDIACRQRTDIAVLKNVNTGPLTSSSFLLPVYISVVASNVVNEATKLIIADVNADGKLDMLTSHNFNESDFSVNINTSDYSIVPPSIAGFTPTKGPVGTSVTINGSKFSPVAANNIVYFGATRATVITATATQLTVIVPAGATYQPISLTVGGLTCNSLQPFNVTFPNGVINGGAFAAKVNFSAVNYPNSIAIGDLDRDGKADLTVTDGNSQASVLINSSIVGSITSTSLNSKFDFTGYSDVLDETKLADIDGDGKLDMIVTNYNSCACVARISIFRNISTGAFTAGSFDTRLDLIPAASLANVVLNDFDSDGKPDILVTSNNSGTISIWRNRSAVGLLSFEKRIDIQAGSASLGVAVGDLDGDSKIDFAVTQSSTISVFHNTSVFGAITTTSFDPKVDFVVGSAPVDISVADLDGDGKLDIITSNSGGNTLSVLYNTATTGPLTVSSFAPHVDFPTAVSPGKMAIGDVDGDGKPDIAVVNNNPRTLSVFRNTTVTGKIDASSLAAKIDFSGGVAGDIALGDVDGDGKPELISLNYNASTIAVLRNTVAPSPIIAVTTQTNSFTACDGTVATLTVAATGTTNLGYQWQKYTGSSYSNLPNSGGYNGVTSATLAFNTLGDFGGGDYRCQISGDLAAPVFSQTATVTVAGVPSQVAITVTGNTSLCNGGSVTLSAPTGFSSYLWSSGETTSSITKTISGSFAVQVANAAGCLSVISDSVKLNTVSTPAKPVIQLTGSAQLCSGSFALLSAPDGFLSYRWSTGETSQKIVVLDSGKYSASVGNAASCLSPASDAITITKTDQPCLGGVDPNNHPPEIKPASFSTAIEGRIFVNLKELITDRDNNLNLSTLRVIEQPPSGAAATIDSLSNLIIDYSPLRFTGTEMITVQVCDFLSSCTEQQLTIDVASDVVAFNALSPNDDGKNDVFILQFIDLIPETKGNKVTIYNRWGDLVFSIDDYNNTTKVFRGLDDHGKELPVGVYFYNVDFDSGKKGKSGFINLRK